jgi:hypothetical protein
MLAVRGPAPPSTVEPRLQSVAAAAVSRARVARRSRMTALAPMSMTGSFAMLSAIAALCWSWSMISRPSGPAARAHRTGPG